VNAHLASSVGHRSQAASTPAMGEDGHRTVATERSRVTRTPPPGTSKDTADAIGSDRPDPITSSAVAPKEAVLRQTERRHFSGEGDEDFTRQSGIRAASTRRVPDRELTAGWSPRSADGSARVHAADLLQTVEPATASRSPEAAEVPALPLYTALEEVGHLPDGKSEALTTKPRRTPDAARSAASGAGSAILAAPIRNRAEGSTPRNPPTPRHTGAANVTDRGESVVDRPVQVTIGRIEIREQRPTSPSPAKRASQARLSLREYLSCRMRGPGHD
jgi:hypothetical protein